MIRYALACDQGHDFESWFPSSGSFDDQLARGLVACPHCASPRVEKRLMAPSLGRRANAAAPAPGPVADAPAPPAQEVPPAAPQPVAILSEREQAVRALLRAVREHVTKTADYVGPAFAEEARKIHYGETDHRSIYGEADRDEVRALIEEGIEIAPLPVGPDDRN